MAVFSSAYPLGVIRAQLLPNPTLFPAIRKKSVIQKRSSDSFRVFCHNFKEDAVEAISKEGAKGSGGAQWELLKPWDVPWDWKVTSYVMMPYLMSILLTGIVESARQHGPVEPYADNILSQLNRTDELAIKLFMEQFLKSAAKLLVLYIFVRPHRPLPDNVFSLEWGNPFNVKNGWILWAVGGLSVASFIDFLLKVLISGLYTGHADNEAEPLLRLLPMIGSSNISTVCLLGSVGILAPVCEEVLYRGFLLASLTKWLPMTFSVVASSTIFTLAHQSPGKSLDIFIFGTVLGLIYAQTRNLLAPITMHALWNCGVILFLTYLHSQGYDMHKYVL